MKRFTILPALMGLILLCGMTIAVAGETEAEQTTITVVGEIVEIGCYLERGQKAADNPTCIKRCTANGMPMGLLAKGDTLYLILRNHAAMDAYDKAKELAAERVEITGVVVDKAGVRGILVTSVKKIEDAGEAGKTG